MEECEVSCEEEVEEDGGEGVGLSPFPLPPFPLPLPEEPYSLEGFGTFSLQPAIPVFIEDLHHLSHIK